MYPHKTLNLTRGIVYSKYFRRYLEVLLADKLKNQVVAKVERTKKIDGVLTPPPFLLYLLMLEYCPLR